jgi:hypothetical protein
MDLKDSQVFVYEFRRQFYENVPDDLLKDNFFLSFEFLLLYPCTTEQWLALHWWYAYHSLKNPCLAHTERRFRYAHCIHNVEQ